MRGMPIGRWSRQVGRNHSAHAIPARPGPHVEAPHGHVALRDSSGVYPMAGRDGETEHGVFVPFAPTGGGGAERSRPRSRKDSSPPFLSTGTPVHFLAPRQAETVSAPNS